MYNYNDPFDSNKQKFSPSNYEPHVESSDDHISHEEKPLENMHPSICNTCSHFKAEAYENSEKPCPVHCCIYHPEHKKCHHHHEHHHHHRSDEAPTIDPSDVRQFDGYYGYQRPYYPYYHRPYYYPYYRPYYNPYYNVIPFVFPFTI